MTGRLIHKYALVTGGTAGIGLETAIQFQQEGAHVIVTGRSETGLAKAKQVLGDAAIVIRNDASDYQQQLALAKQLIQIIPKLDVLYINAGDVTHQPIESWDEQQFNQIINTNLKGPFFLIQALLPLLANPASIILCGSVSAQIGLAQSSLYAASKAGLISLARTLSGELQARGIRVNALSPGPTSTNAFDNFGLPADEKAALMQQVSELVPLQRLGTPTEIAKAAVFMASDESSYMLGAELLIDGGVGNI